MAVEVTLSPPWQRDSLAAAAADEGGVIARRHENVVPPSEILARQGEVTRVGMSYGAGRTDVIFSQGSRTGSC